MHMLIRKLAISAVTAATVLATIPLAEARDRHGRGDYRPPVVGMSSKPADKSRDTGGNPYRQPRPSPDRNYSPAAPGNYPNENYYVGPPVPWSPAWYYYCSTHHRSFVPETGMYTTSGGEKRFCVAE